MGYLFVPVLSDACAYRLSPDPDAYAYLRFGLLASFCGMKRMSVETSDAVRSTVPPGLALPHVSACLVTLRVPDPAVCPLSDGEPGFVSDVFGLAAYICYKCMLSSPRMTRVRMTVLSGRVS